MSVSELESIENRGMVDGFKFARIVIGKGSKVKMKNRSIECKYNRLEVF